MSIISQALEQIKASGLDKFRCNMTGAPYATLDEYEILIALRSMLELDSKLTVDRMVDQWQLRALSFNSQSLPSLRGANQKALLSMIATGTSGNVKVLTYLMTRLFYPHIGAEPMHSEKARDRMLFAVDLYDSAMTWDTGKLAALVQQLSVVDSYLSMPHWHTLWLFESAFSKVGLAKSPAAIQEAFAEPATMIGNVARIDSVIKFMYELMLHCAERDGAAGRSGNRMSQEIMFVSAQLLPKIVIPHFQKTLSEADKLRLEEKRRIDSKKELRVAHSAIHGKNYAPGANVADAIRNARELKANLATKKAEPKPKKDTVNPLFRAAFASLANTFDPNKK